jgi:RNA polymerase sigma-70 factor (ECF subfamily)
MTPAAFITPARCAPPFAGSVLRAGAALLHQAVHSFGGVANLAGKLAGARRADATPAGSLPSFEAAALPHLDAVYNLARFLCHDTSVAEDVAQEAYLRAFRSWGEFRGGSVRAWLFAIVRNCHFTYREQVQRDRARTAARPGGTEPDRDEDPVLLVAAEGDPEHTLLRQDEDARVRQTLDKLPEETREILVLRDIEDCSYREIADVLGLPIGTVMSRLSRARRAFAARWQAAMPEARP